MNDEQLRARLRALAEQEALPTLSAAARVQVEQAASLQVGERHGTGWALAGALMLAGIVCWQVFREPPRIVQVVTPAPAPATRCQAFAGRSIADAQLAGRATFAATQASDVAIDLSADCDVQANLRLGSLFVHAENLQGRSLRVVTPHGRVEVRGTVFAVHTTEHYLTVEVDEGHVEVTASDRTVSLRAGDAVRIEAQSVQQSPAPSRARSRLRSAVHLAPGDAGAQVWRTGSVPTPSIPPEPKTSVTEDGRPMRKPQLIPGE